jgi:copper chaperone NosL
MKSPATIAIAAASLALSLSAGCQRKELTGPPSLRLGRDQCAECGMIISEPHAAGALLIERRGVREYLLFDDAGCMIDRLSALPDGAAIITTFVHDHEADEWTDAADASFVLAGRDALKTPMGSGIAAFADRAAAERCAAATQGEVLAYAPLIESRRAQQAARRTNAPSKENP